MKTRLYVRDKEHLHFIPEVERMSTRIVAYSEGSLPMFEWGSHDSKEVSTGFEIQESGKHLLLTCQFSISKTTA